MKVIGLTGGIASGKTTVSTYLKSKGYKVIDADLISRDIYHIGKEAYRKIIEEFGEGILDNQRNIDRKILGSIVFNDKYKLSKLNEITHPIIVNEILRKIEEIKLKGEKICFVDAALLIEANLAKYVDEVWLVVVDEVVQLDRLMKRDKLSFAEAKKRIESQMNVEEKKKFADYIIDNSKSVEYTIEQVTEMLNKAIYGGIK